MMTIKAVMFDFGATLIMDDNFDYPGSLCKAHKLLESERIAPSFGSSSMPVFELKSTCGMSMNFENILIGDRLAEVLKLFNYKLPESDAGIKPLTSSVTHRSTHSTWKTRCQPCWSDY